jgi:hypothetical protein
VAGKQRDHQRRQRQARQASEAAALASARSRRRRAIILAAGVAALVVVVALVVNAQGESSKVATSASTTTVPATDVSAPSGTTCVAVADPLPPGAPEIPVKVGPPPRELVTEDLKVGTGTTVAAGDTVTVHYVGVSCSTGKIFDSSYSRSQPATFGLTQVIKGWTDGIPGMKVGGQRLLGIPPSQAYGAQGRPPTIAPNETLWFVVEVLDTKPT